MDEASKQQPRRKLWPLLFVLLLIIVVAVFPTPHTRIRMEHKSVLLRRLDCSGTLKDGYYWYWDLTDLPPYVRIVVDVGSTEEVRVYIKSVEGVVCDREGKVHDYTLYAKGPSLHVEVINPTTFGLGSSAVVSGGIEVYHDYEARTEYTEWTLWWMP